MTPSKRRTKRGLVSLAAALLFIPFGWSVGDSAVASSMLQGEEEPIPCDSEPTEMTIEFGDLVTCQIDPVGDTDTFRFAATAGEVVSVQVARQAGLGRADMELFDPDGNQLGALGLRVDAKLVKTGLYSVRVSGTGRSVSYALSLERLAPPSPSAAPLPAGQPLTGTITPSGDIDLYFFRGASGDNVTITATREAGLGSPMVELYDPEGNRIGDPGDQVQAQLVKEGIYAVRVNELDDNNPVTYGIERDCSGQCPPVGEIRSVLVLPLVTVGQASEGTRRVTFVLLNISNSVAEGSLELLQPDGMTPLNVTIDDTSASQFPISIPARGVRVLEAEGSGSLAQGLAKVTTDRSIRASIMVRSATRSGRVIFDTSYAVPIPTNLFTVVVNSIGKDADTGLVVFNPSSDQTAELTLTRSDRDGQTVGSPMMFSVNPGAVSTGPSGDIIRFVSADLFSGEPGINEFEGTLSLTSSIPVSILAVQKKGTRLVVVPVF